MFGTRRWVFRRWSGRRTEILAERVEFTPGGGLAFWTGDQLVLAVQRGDWNDLTEARGGEGS